MPELNSEFNVPETYIDIPRGREGLSSVAVARARWGVADVFSGSQNSPEDERQLLTEQIRQVTPIAVDLRKKRIDGTIDLHEGDSRSGASLMKRAFSLLTGVEAPKLFTRPVTERSLIHEESKIGAQIFGDVSAYSQREFFCLDESTWIWYEATQDAETGQQTAITTRYEIHPNGILKAQEGSHYTYIEGDELRNLAAATQIYVDRISNEIYNSDIAA